MMTAVICVNGVLRLLHNRDGIDRLGRSVFEGLKANFRIVLLDDAGDKGLQHWLDVHGVDGHTRVYTPPADFAPRTVADGRLKMLAAIRNQTGIDLVVEPDSACAAEEIRAGYNVMFYASPQYLMERWHPDASKEPRPWDDIVNEVDSQRSAKAHDKRLKDLDD